MALYAIGDIHGSLPALKSIFNQNVITKDDLVIFLGDYVDRGPNSKGVLDWLITHSSRYHFKFIGGNHEIMMKEAKTSTEKLLTWLHFGGAATLESYDIGNDPQWMRVIDPAHWAFIDTCLPYYERNDFIFVHAGLEKGKDLSAQNEDYLFWKKFELPGPYQDGKTVVCGHTSRKNGEIANFGHTICIYTNALGVMWLTCLNVETKEYIKANNLGRIQLGRL